MSDTPDRDNPSGLRIGFQDVTRRGFKEDDIKHLCDLMLSVMKEKKKTSKIKGSILELKKEFRQVKYGFESLEEVIKYCESL